MAGSAGWWLRHLPVVLGNNMSKLSSFLRSSSTEPFGFGIPPKLRAKVKTGRVSGFYFGWVGRIRTCE